METEPQPQKLSLLFGGRIYSIPCRASCFASVDLEGKVEFLPFFMAGLMKKNILEYVAPGTLSNSSLSRMII